MDSAKWGSLLTEVISQSGPLFILAVRLRAFTDESIAIVHRRRVRRWTTQSTRRNLRKSSTPLQVSLGIRLERIVCI